MLLLQAIYPNISIENLSNSDDSQLMQKGVQARQGTVDIHHAGTAMRFLTAYFASLEGADILLTGSERMQQRPIRLLVDALTQLGADIQYTAEQGFPPLRIKGKKLSKQKVSLPADVSSQYISALLLIAPKLQNGLELELIGRITSIPYIRMTCSLLSELGIENSFEGNSIRVKPKKQVANTSLVVESDWSSASYFYSLAAMSPKGTELRLSSYKSSSLQGDSVLQEIYRFFGVETEFNGQSAVLRKISETHAGPFRYDLIQAPDLAQTIAVTCLGLGVGCELSGLHTLKIKETDRLEAMKTELSKLGADIQVTDKELILQPSKEIRPSIEIDTYHDHRMAMAFGPLALKTPIIINDAEVVSKSYPDFWQDLSQLGIEVREE